MIYYTYVYRDPTTHIPRYVGKGSKRRAFKHLKSTSTNKTLKGWINNLKKNNLDPDIEIIYALNEDHSFFLETCLIKIFGRIDKNTGTLFNHTDGGEGSAGRVPWNKGKKLPPLTQERKDNISKIHKNKIVSDKTKEKMSISATGKSKSPEHRKKLSEANIGKIASYETREKLSKIHKGKKQKILICPYCKKTGGTTMHRWHFDNCKTK